MLNSNRKKTENVKSFQYSNSRPSYFLAEVLTAPHYQPGNQQFWNPIDLGAKEKLLRELLSSAKIKTEIGLFINLASSMT